MDFSLNGIPKENTNEKPSLMGGGGEYGGIHSSFSVEWLPITKETATNRPRHDRDAKNISHQLVEDTLTIH